MRELSNGSLTARLTLLGLAFVLCGSAGGCAALANPVSWQAVEVRRLPPEVLGRRREEEKPIPESLLTQPQPENYLLDAGDVMGIFIETVLGEKGSAPPLNFPREGSRLPPAVGFPVPIGEDGMLALPLIDPINVKGKTRAQAEELIKKAYTNKGLIDLKAARVIVSILRERQYHINVVREDSGLSGGVTGGFPGAIRRGAGFALELPAYENDVLNALNKTGGLPGLDAKSQVVIYRAPTKGTAAAGGPGSAPFSVPGIGGDRYPGQIIRIPLRLRPGEPVPFKPEDVVLRTGDIIKIESRDTELYYTGGLLPVGEFVLPRDYDLDVIEAIAQVHGPFLNGAVNNNNLSGNTLPTGIGQASPSQLTVLRRLPGGGQIPIRVDLNRAFQDPRERILVKPGDVLVLQETVGETISRYLAGTIRYNFFFRIFNGTNENGSVTATVP